LGHFDPNSGDMGCHFLLIKRFSDAWH